MHINNMDTVLTPPNIIFVLGLLGTIFSVYSYFRNPQINSEKDDALMSQKIASLEVSIAALNASFNSHIISDQTSFGLLNQHVVEVDKSVVKLTTIIDERIPKK